MGPSAEVWSALARASMDSSGLQVVAAVGLLVVRQDSRADSSAPKLSPMGES